MKNVLIKKSLLSIPRHLGVISLSMAQLWHHLPKHGSGVAPKPCVSVSFLLSSSALETAKKEIEDSCATLKQQHTGDKSQRPSFA